MSDDDFPEEHTAEQKKELYRDLLALKKELEEALDRSLEGSRPVELDQQKFGRVSRIDAIQQQKMNQATRRRQQFRLQQVKGALEAWERERYGECRECEELIAFKRLKARPETPFCLQCQAELERR